MLQLCYTNYRSNTCDKAWMIENFIPSVSSIAVLLSSALNFPIEVYFECSSFENSNFYAPFNNVNIVSNCFLVIGLILALPFFDTCRYSIGQEAPLLTTANTKSEVRVQSEVSTPSERTSLIQKKS